MANDLKRTLMNAPNAVVGWVIGRLGRSPGGAELLDVRGRTSGVVRTVPVNPLELDGRRYLVAPRGETQWVKNLRVVREGVLRVGQRRDEFEVARELPDDEKAPILRAYLDRWYWQVSRQFGVPKDATLDQLSAIAQNHPVFEIREQTRA